jgi:hypothetical protein
VARLISSAIASLDGYVADEHGDFGWAAPDEEVRACGSSCWTSAASAAAWSTCATAP